MADAVIEIFMDVRHLHGQHVCPGACAASPFELIDTLHRLQSPVSIIAVMETRLGVTDAFVAIRIRQTTRDTRGCGGSAGE